MEDLLARPNAGVKVLILKLHRKTELLGVELYRRSKICCTQLWAQICYQHATSAGAVNLLPSSSYQAYDINGSCRCAKRRRSRARHGVSVACRDKIGSTGEGRERLHNT